MLCRLCHESLSARQAHAPQLVAYLGVQCLLCKKSQAGKILSDSKRSQAISVCRPLCGCVLRNTTIRSTPAATSPKIFDILAHVSPAAAIPLVVTRGQVYIQASSGSAVLASRDFSRNTTAVCQGGLSTRERDHLCFLLVHFITSPLHMPSPRAWSSFFALYVSTNNLFLTKPSHAPLQPYHQFSTGLPVHTPVTSPTF